VTASLPRTFFLFCVACSLALCGFYKWVLIPRHQRHDELVHRKEQLVVGLESARLKFTVGKQAEQKAAAARGALNHFLGDDTSDSAMVAFPKEIEDHFTRFGLRDVVVRMATTEKVPKLPGYERVFWSVGVSVPRTDRNAEGLLLAVSDLEQQSRFIKVIDFAMQPSPEDQSLRTATVNMMIVAKKQ